MSPRKCKEIDQMYLNVYYFRCAAGTGSGHVLSIPPRPWFASSALVDPISKTFVAALEDFARRLKISVIQFRKGQRKDDIAAEQRKKFTKAEGVVFIGKAQEKTAGVPHRAPSE